MSSDISIGSLIVPTVFTPYVNEQSVLKNVFLRSGIIANSPLISGKLAGAGRYATILTFQNLDTSSTAANATSADQSSSSTPEQIHADSQQFVRIGRNKSWSAADWDTSLLGQDPMAYIGAMVVDAVMKWRQTTLINILTGQVAAAISASSATVLSVQTETVGTPYASTTQINATNIAAALVGAWGDMGTRDTLMNGMNGVAIFMHSKTYAFLLKTDYVSFQRQSLQEFGFTTYLGYPVFVDDTLPARVGTTSGHVYTTFFVRAGAVNFGYAPPKNATEVWRNPDAGNGGGADKLYQRDNFSFHTTGFSYTGSLTGDNVSDSALATGTNWTQALLPKQTGVVALVHNLDV